MPSLIMWLVFLVGQLLGLVGPLACVQMSLLMVGHGTQHDHRLKSG